MSAYGTLLWKLERLETGEMFNANNRIVEYITHRLGSIDLKTITAKLDDYTLFNTQEKFIGKYVVHELTESEIAFFRSINYEMVTFYPYSNKSFDAVIITKVFKHDDISTFDAVQIDIVSQEKVYFGSFILVDTPNIRVDRGNIRVDQRFL